MIGEWNNGTGRRKSSVARVFLKKGTGKITVNGKDIQGWHVSEGATATWRVKDGTLIGSGDFGYLITDRTDFRNFRLRIEAMLGAGGDSVWMQPPFFCDYGANILLGERVFFNFNCVVLDVCQVRIGDFTLFGPAVQVYTATHPMNAELRRKQEFSRPIEIGSDVWVGGGAIICPGVRIGSRSVIGGGSVVTRDIPDEVFAAGNPCRVIREITE